MRRLLTLLALISGLYASALAAETIHPANEKIENFLDGDIYQVAHPDWFLPHDFLDLQESLQDAIDNDKTGLMVFYTTEGCSYCALFIQESLGNPAIREKLQGRFDTIGLEIFDDTGMTTPNGDSLSVKAFAKREKAHMAPTLLFFDASGQQVFRAVGYQNPERFSAMIDYVADGHTAKISFANYLKKATTAANNSYSTLRDDALFSAPPFALDRSRVAANHPLLVVWESTGCTDCQQWHDEVISEPGIRQLMQQFEVVRLDANDASTPILRPDGGKTTPADWYSESGLSHLPAFLLFDGQGKEAIRVDALALQSRMSNMLNYMLDKAYEKDWTYQRFARSQARKKRGLDSPY